MGRRVLIRFCQPAADRQSSSLEVLMNVSRLGALGAAVLLSVVACASAPGPDRQPSPQSQIPGAGAAGVASAGDIVYLIEHHVQPERREQFELFVQDVLWPAFQRSASAAGRPVPRIRLLIPEAATDDGSYPYTFVLDPIVAGEPYNVLDVLREAYGAEEALRHYGLYTATWADDFTARRFVQSR
jgi:hypothetical protein